MRGLLVNTLTIVFETFRNILVIVPIVNLEVGFQVRDIKY